METISPSSDSHEESVSKKNTNEENSLSWEAREHETIERNKQWYLVAGAILSGIIIYAIVTESPIMAITFILIGVVGYLSLHREYPLLTFTIDSEGVHVGNTLYPYENIESFWIFYEPGKRKCISLAIDADLTPFVHIPLGELDPVRARSLLLQFAPEKKHYIRLIDILDEYF